MSDIISLLVMYTLSAFFEKQNYKILQYALQIISGNTLLFVHHCVLIPTEYYKRCTKNLRIKEAENSASKRLGYSSKTCTTLVPPFFLEV